MFSAKLMNTIVIQILFQQIFYETGRGNWVYPGLSYVNGGSGGSVSGASAECNTWQKMEVGNVGCG